MNFKSDLKKAYYKPFTESKRRWQCGDSRVDPDQWRVLVEHWEKDEIAEQPKRMLKIRNKKHGEDPDPIWFFQDKHTRRDEDRSWVKSVAEQKYEKLKELVEDECPDNLETRRRAYVKAMGLETNNSVRGEGLGVKPHQELLKHNQQEIEEMRQCYRARRLRTAAAKPIPYVVLLAADVPSNALSSQ
ncbi:hypothetical protein Prudu_170S000500, partial [Prunus dulcis]